MSDKEPYILEPTDPAAGRPATIIFLHGFADEAEGLPLGTPRSNPCVFISDIQRFGSAVSIP